METNRRAPARVAALVLALALVLTGCGLGGDDTRAGASSAGGGPTATTIPGRCTGADLRATLQVGTTRAQAFDDGAALTTLIVTNSADRPCTVEGWPRIAVLGPHYQVSPFTANNNPVPRSPEAIVLHPGHSAFAGLEFPVPQERARCPTLNDKIRVYPPGSAAFVVADVVPAQALLPVCEPAEMGILQPTRDGLAAR